MKKRSSNSDLHPVKKRKNEPKLPVEVCRLILSMLPFKDQVNCRLVCKDWLDVVTNLPEFKHKNHLNLDYCELSDNEEPLSTILSSKLKFNSMKVGDKLTLALSPNLLTFVARMAETVTHLDISHALADSNRIIVENLHLFNVLHYLKVQSLSDWLLHAYFTFPEKHVLKDMVSWILGKDFRFVSHDMVKSFLETNNLNGFHQGLFLNRYKNFLLKKITDKLDRLNAERFLNKTGTETIDSIVDEVISAIKRADKSRDLSTRINVSVRVVAFGGGFKTTSQMIDQMLKLVPNVEEFEIYCTAAFGGMDKILEKLSTKITRLDLDYVEIYHLERFQFNLPNLKHLSVGDPMSAKKFCKEDIERCITLVPSIETINVATTQVPQAYFDYITDLHISPKTTLKLNLTNLVAFKNLQTLHINVEDDIRYGSYRYCFFSHEPLRLKTIKALNFSPWKSNFCVQCFKALLESLPNLKSLLFCSCLKGNFANMIFERQQNLVELSYRNKFQQETKNTFEPNSKWPKMNRLENLEVSTNYIGGDYAAWIDFAKKLPKLKYLEVKANQSLNVDILKVIKSEEQSIMPSLKRVKIIVPESPDYFKTTVTMALEVNGRKILIDK